MANNFDILIQAKLDKSKEAINRIKNDAASIKGVEINTQLKVSKESLNKIKEDINNSKADIKANIQLKGEKDLQSSINSQLAARKNLAVNLPVRLDISQAAISLIQQDLIKLSDALTKGKNALILPIQFKAEAEQIKSSVANFKKGEKPTVYNKETTDLSLLEKGNASGKSLRDSTQEFVKKQVSENAILTKYKEELNGLNETIRTFVAEHQLMDGAISKTEFLYNEATGELHQYGEAVTHSLAAKKSFEKELEKENEQRRKKEEAAEKEREKALQEEQKIRKALAKEEEKEAQKIEKALQEELRIKEALVKAEEKAQQSRQEYTLKNASDYKDSSLLSSNSSNNYNDTLAFAKANFGEDATISKYQENIKDAGDTLRRFTVQQRDSEGVLKTVKLELNETTGEVREYNEVLGKSLAVEQKLMKQRQAEELFGDTDFKKTYFEGLDRDTALSKVTNRDRALDFVLDETTLGFNEKNGEALNTVISNYSRGVNKANEEVLKFTATQTMLNGTIEKTYFEQNRTTGVLEQGKTVITQSTKATATLSENLRNTIQRTIEWGTAMYGVHAAVSYLKNSVQFISEIDKDITQIAITTGQTRQETEKLIDTYVTLGREMGKTVKEISSVNAELVRQGLSLEEAQNRMESILKLSATGNMGVEQTLSVITSSVNALGESAERTGDILLKAGMISASGPDSIGEALQGAASSAKAAGMEIDELSSIISTLIDVTQESPSSLGNSLKTIISRFNAVSSETGELNKDLNKVQTAFESVGISFVDQRGQIRPMFDLLSELSGKWDELSKSERSYIAYRSAGTMQQNRFYAIMDNFDRVKDIYDQLQGAEGTLDSAYATYLDSIEAQANKTRVALEELWLNAMDSETVKGLLKMTEGLFSVLGKLGGLLVPIGLVSTALFLMSTRNNILGKTFHIVSKAMEEDILKTGKLASTKQYLKMVTDGLGLSIKRQKINTDQLSSSTSSQIAKTVKLTAATASLKITTLALSTVATLGIGVLISALFKAADQIILTGDELRELIGEFEQANNKFIETKVSLNQLKDEFEELTGKMGESADKSKLTAAEQERYNEIVSELIGIAPDIIDYYNENGEAVLKYGTTIDGVIEKQKEFLDNQRNMLLAEADKIAFSINFDKFKADAKYAFSEVITGAKMFATLIPLAPKGEEAGQVTEDQLKNLQRLAEADLEKNKQRIDAINEAIEPLKDISKVKMTSVFEDFEVPSEFEGFLNNLSETLLDLEYKANKGDVSNTLDDVYFKINGLREILGPLFEQYEKGNTSLAENKDLFQQQAKVLEQLGFTSEQSEDILTKLANAFVKASTKSEDFYYSVRGITSLFEEQLDIVDKLQASLEKLYSGDSLDKDTLFKYIEEYQVVADYIAETGDLSLKQGEILKDILLEQEKVAYSQLQLEKQKQAELQKQSAEKLRQLEAEKQAFLQINPNADTSSIDGQIKDASRSVNDFNGEMAILDAKLKAIYYTMKEDFVNAGLEREVALLDEATSKYEDYTKFLEEIKEYGELSGDSNKKIVSKYQDLIPLLSNMAELQKTLNHEVANQSDYQQQAYRNMTLYSEQFYKFVLDKNKSLVQKLADLYKIDANNFKSMNDLKMAISSKVTDETLVSIKQMAEKNGQTYLESLKHHLELAKKQMELNPLLNNEEQFKLIANIELEISDLEEREAFQNTLDKIDFNKEFDKSNSSSKKKAIELVELEIDRYLKLSKAIEEVNKAQERNSKLLEYATGKDKINLLSKEIELLTKKQQLTSQMNELQKKEKTDLEKELGKTINLKDGSLGIESFNTYTKKQEAAINNLITKINKTSNDDTRETLEDQKDALDKKYNKFKELFDRYLELTTELIPDSSAEWWNIHMEKFSKSMEMLDTNMEKYSQKVERIKTQLEILGEVRSEDTLSVSKQLKLMEDITNVYKQSIGDIQSNLLENSKLISSYESKLAQLKDVQSQEYKTTSTLLILARNEQDKLVQAYEEGIKNLAAEQQTLKDEYINHLTEAREKTVKAFQEMRKELDSFSEFEFKMDISKIEEELNKIDKIFIERPPLNLDTDTARENLDTLKDDILSILDKVNGTKEKFNTLMKKEIKSKEDLLEQEEKLLELIQSQIDYENTLKEQSEELNEQILEMELHHKEIENSLQNQIDLKEEEITALDEQYEKEEKIKSTLQKQLDLIKAMNSRTNSYISTDGTEILTYDREAVSKLQAELEESKKKDREEAEKEKLQEELEKLKEEFDKTVEINQKELDILQKSKDSIDKMVDLIGEQVDKMLGEEGLESLTEKASELAEQSFKVVMEPIGNTLESIYKILEKRLDIKAAGETSVFNTGRSISVGIGDTVSTVAARSGMTEAQLMAINPELRRDADLYMGQNLNVSRSINNASIEPTGISSYLAQIGAGALQNIDIAKSMSERMGGIAAQPMSVDRSDSNVIHVDVMNFNGVQNVSDFQREMNEFLRKGFSTLN